MLPPHPPRTVTLEKGGGMFRLFLVKPLLGALHMAQQGNQLAAGETVDVMAQEPRQ